MTSGTRTTGLNQSMLRALAHVGDFEPRRAKNGTIVRTRRGRPVYDPSGKNGLVGSLCWLARTYPGTFTRLLSHAVAMEEKIKQPPDIHYRLLRDGTLVDPPSDPLHAVLLAAQLTGDREPLRGNNGRVLRNQRGKVRYGHTGKDGMPGYLHFLTSHRPRLFARLLWPVLDIQEKNPPQPEETPKRFRTREGPESR